MDEVASEAEEHPTWKRLDELLRKAKGTEKANGIASAHSMKARDEAARKLISNHTRVIADVTNPSLQLNIEGKPLTQTGLKRVDVFSRPYVDQMLREVARRLLGRRSGVLQFEEKADRSNTVQANAWQGCAAYLATRAQSKPDQKPGRRPDMNEAAAAAFLAVVAEVASEAEIIVEPLSPTSKEPQTPLGPSTPKTPKTPKTPNTPKRAKTPQDANSM